jgi:3-oxoacyl-[acyl-carrier protein] reductase
MTLVGLAKKVVIVTGASRGIGRAVAERFAREGAHLVLSSRRGGDPLHATVAACAAAGAQVVTVEGDVGDPAVAADLAARAQERFGRIDVLVSCAGVALEELLVATGDDAARRTVETNVLGTIWAARAVAPAMLRQRGGCIVTLSSSLARRPARGSTVYAGTKGFVEAFTAALAAEVGRKGIRAVCVAPGLVETEMTAALRRDAPEAALRGIAAGRVATPAEIAATIAFLASDDASYVNGAVLAVDGGHSAGG